eukprot:CAMPEP_0179926036 /NCGR_PEP_ID=MMETSP0983-20121128/7571_1 /TAXON_ID=483367 /ORGANISM="non described non described, Strain CCMP 2436" /LENGTH=503 /DNA_ID=CAMNT_0021829649 /DNA_START=284 /DNA_END=1797 /DNA_ORIENTATION=-
MALTCPVCKAPGPLDTKHHLYHECWATKKHRDDLHGALCAKLALRLGNPIATTLTKRMMTRPDYYSGQIGMSIKDELKKESGGEAPKLGDLHLILLHHSLEMRTLRKAAIETSTAVTKDKISVHDAHKFKIAMWAAQAAEKAAEKDTNRPSTITTTRTNTQLQQRDGRRATQRPPPPPPVRATSHNPIPRVRLEAIRGEPHQREQAATQQNLDRTPPAASPTMLHAPTSRPPRKRAQSQATPATPPHASGTPPPHQAGHTTDANTSHPPRATNNGRTHRTKCGHATHAHTHIALIQTASGSLPVHRTTYGRGTAMTPEASTVNTPAFKRSQSRAKPDTPQPTPATQKRPTPLGPPVPQAAAAHITAAEDMPAPPHPRILRPCKRPLEANQTFPPLMEPDQTQQSIVEQQRPRTTRLPIDNSGTTTARVPHHRALRSSMRPNAATQTQTPQQPTEKRQKRRRREGQCPEATPADARQERKREVQCPENTTQHIEPEAHHPEGVG